MASQQPQTEAQQIQTVLITGGARSGKSVRAEQLVRASGLGLLYVATGTALDAEMAARIKQHQDRRGPEWRLIEERLDIARIIAENATPGRALLIDCLTLWLSNLTFEEQDIDAATDRLCDSLGKARGAVVLVTNEIGLGIVPETKLARRFRDDQGRLNQRVAEVVDAVECVVAGQALQLKPTLSPPLSLVSLKKAP